MKVAVVHDWLVGYAGGEKVLEQIIAIFPECDIFSLIDFIPEQARGFIQGKSVNTSFIQKMPFSRNKYRNYLPLMPIAIEQFDFSGYDLVLSSSAAISKGVITGPYQLHISYCHSPIRYAWDLQFQYLQESGLERGMRSWLVRAMLHKIRQWDYRTANGVDEFIANSNFIARRIYKVYRRESTVIHPPVDTDFFSLEEKKDDFYLAVSRMVPYKKMELIVRAFGEMRDKRLIVIGDGPCLKNIRQIATKNVEVLGYRNGEDLLGYLQKARALVFAALEDFGIVPVEAQACGTPVIAFGKGGVRDSVIPGETGIFFEKQDIGSIIEAVKRFEYEEYDPQDIRRHAEQFSISAFQERYKEFVSSRWSLFTQGYK